MGKRKVSRSAFRERTVVTERWNELTDNSAKSPRPWIRSRIVNHRLTLGSLALLAVFGADSGQALAANVGSKASPVEPSEWLNVKGSFSWNAVKGRLVLVEKWATW